MAKFAKAQYPLDITVLGDTDEVHRKNPWPGTGLAVGGFRGTVQPVPLTKNNVIIY